MATVFRAQKHGEEGFSMPCAVKIIHPHLAEQKSFTEMFIREAKLASKLSHPNIVQVIDFGSVNYNYYLVMEFIDGSDLFSLIEYRFSLPQDIALSILFEISKALIYAHEKGIIHRDISSGNILISDHAAVKIADFGIAQANQFENFTREGMVRGKGTYMSPEQSRGENLNEKTDIFSLGIVFLEMAEGFDRLKAKRDRKLKEEELMPRDLDHEVAEVILRMLKEAPKERISTIELYQKLKDLADQQFFSPNEDLLKSMIKGIPRTEEFQGTEVSESAHDPDAFIPTTKYERTPERPIGRPGLKNSLKIWPGIILV